MFFSAVWAFLMPNVSNSVYFHNERSESIDQPTPPIANPTSSSDASKIIENIESQPSNTKVT